MIFLIGSANKKNLPELQVKNLSQGEGGSIAAIFSYSKQLIS